MVRRNKRPNTQRQDPQNRNARAKEARRKRERDLRVDEVLAVEFVLAGGGVAAEEHACPPSAR
eukprot:596505-Rhodomonas_salina.4